MNFDEIVCSYCYNFYNLSDRIPLILPSCNHTFCSSCLQAFLTKATFGESFVCPKDKQPVPLSSLNLTQFSENVNVIKTLERREAASSNTQTPTLSPGKYSTSSPIFNKTFEDYKFSAVTQDSPMSLVSGLINPTPLSGNLNMGTILTKSSPIMSENQSLQSSGQKHLTLFMHHSFSLLKIIFSLE